MRLLWDFWFWWDSPGSGHFVQTFKEEHSIFSFQRQHRSDQIHSTLIRFTRLKFAVKALAFLQPSLHFFVFPPKRESFLFYRNLGQKIETKEL